MALATPVATVATIKELGGIQADDDYNLWRFTTPEDLDGLLTRNLQRAASRIYRIDSSFYSSTDENLLSDLAAGEAWLALHLSTMPLKSRKVFGTHWALDQEESARFQELIDNEYLARAEEALGIDLTTTGSTNVAFARPTFQITSAIDPSQDQTLETETEQLTEIAQEARGWPIVPVVPAP